MKNVEHLIVECSLARAAAIFDVYVPKSGRHDCTRDDCFDDGFPALVKSLIKHRQATVDGEYSVCRCVSENVGDQGIDIQLWGASLEKSREESKASTVRQVAKVRVEIKAVTDQLTVCGVLVDQWNTQSGRREPLL